MTFSWNKWKKRFPLTCNNDVIQFFEELIGTNDVNLVFSSILLGLLEKKLNKISDGNDKSSIDGDSKHSEDIGMSKFLINIHELMPLYKDFMSFVSEIKISKEQIDKKFIDRASLKLITDKIYLKLTSGGKHKEMFHSQTIYSFINDNVLDSFGLAFAVVTIARLLGFMNVRLALSEDHAWIEYDLDEESGQKSTADVAWTGKNEEKRCSPIDSGIVDRSRYYVQGQAVICDTEHKMLAAAITTINPIKSNQSSMNFYSHRTNKLNHSPELACLKRDLLWLCYKCRLLAHYPIALINLADLEYSYSSCHDTEDDSLSSISTAQSSSVPLQLYMEAVKINRCHYQNAHVYPYLSIANFFYHHHEQYKRALKCWRMASSVISKYNYKTEDWIIYREFFDIATSYLPQIFRQNLNQSRGEEEHMSKSSDSHHETGGTVTDFDSKKTTDLLRKDVEFLAEFLLYFDFICLWEEGSSVPVLHEVWANKFKEVLLRFTEETRVQLGRMSLDQICSSYVECDESERDIEEDLELPKMEGLDHLLIKYPTFKHIQPILTPKKKSSPNNKETKYLKEFFEALNNEENENLATILSTKVLNLDYLINASSNNDPDQLFDPNSLPEPVIDDSSCPYHQKMLSDNIIDYFSTFKNVKHILNITSESSEMKDKLQEASSLVDHVLQDLSNNSTTFGGTVKTESSVPPQNDTTTADESNNSDLLSILRSQKMRDIYSLIVSPGKLNVPAIKLPLTAQSQVSLKRTGLPTVYGQFHPILTSRKRLRKD